MRTRTPYADHCSGNTGSRPQDFGRRSPCSGFASRHPARNWWRPASAERRARELETNPRAPKAPTVPRIREVPRTCSYDLRYIIPSLSLVFLERLSRASIFLHERLCVFCMPSGGCLSLFYCTTVPPSVCVDSALACLHNYGVISVCMWYVCTECRLISLVQMRWSGRDRLFVLIAVP
ncbi:hypothetical protein DAEQUDRAFT_98712 [Daedalea quercina L-15889]|uniref:Uncharacterized protein n=1 Tax=Daedalea quercina L-15889 TaxID=1314783 RepID=A0A165SDA3_9APHY|nr:hypothetical protein DAEQUDRAFT_98712 [Daedalea quercina L-15889]